MSSEEKSFFRSLGLGGTLVVGFLAVIMVLIFVKTGNPLPIIVVVTLAVILVAIFFYAKRPGTVIGYPDRPPRAGREAPGTKIGPIHRDQCQFKGCKNREALVQCRKCYRTFCPTHIAHHNEGL